MIAYLLVFPQLFNTALTQSLYCLINRTEKAADMSCFQMKYRFLQINLHSRILAWALNSAEFF